MPQNSAVQLWWWGPVTNNAVELSFVGNSFSQPGEVLTYAPGQSNLAAGLVVYTGGTHLPSSQPVATRFTMQFTVGGVPVPLQVATTLGLPANVGAVLAMPSAPPQFNVNMRFEASYDNVNFQPALDLYDQAGVKPGLMLGAPFRTGAAHVMQLGPITIAHVHNQVANDGGEVGG